jgi:broad specificity phosphatase PhoE
VAAVAADLGAAHPGATAVLVSHQDPVQAARLLLTGGDLAALHRGQPAHAAVITLTPGTPWLEASYWAPDGPATRFPPV